MTRPIKQRAPPSVQYKGPLLDLEAAERAERRGTRYLYEVSKHRTIDGTPRRNIARYANHSCNPNAEVPLIWRGRVFIKALRYIKPGEEIVDHYDTDHPKMGDRPLELQMRALPQATGPKARANGAPCRATSPSAELARERRGRGERLRGDRAIQHLDMSSPRRRGPRYTQTSL